MGRRKRERERRGEERKREKFKKNGKKRCLELNLCSNLPINTSHSQESSKIIALPRPSTMNHVKKNSFEILS